MENTFMRRIVVGDIPQIVACLHLDQILSWVVHKGAKILAYMPQHGNSLLGSVTTLAIESLHMVLQN